MGIEIERKYIVNKKEWSLFFKGEGQDYKQGYIVTDPAKTIRIRLADGDGFITIKGLSVGASRPEFEYAIPEWDAQELLEHFCTSVVHKIRYKVLYSGKLWEVDEFSGANEGLIVAEIELSSEQELFDLPTWIEREVTGDERYYNSNLSLHPYKSWKVEP